MSSLTRRSFVASSLGALACSQPQERPPKNVLFIAVDDLRPSLGCYGAGHVLSPNIDRLAARGVRFDRAYCQQAVCGPTRASLLTGLRPDSSTIHSNLQRVQDTIPEIVSLPRHFRNHGYETVSIGKIYHFADDDAPAWSMAPWRPSGEWTGRGYMAEESSRIAADQEQEALAAWEKAKAANPQAPRPRTGMGPAYEAPDVPDNAYPDGKNADKAIAELRRLKDQPFFLATGFFKPHLPFNAPKKYWDLYDRDALPLASQTDWPAASPAMAHTNWGELRGYHGMPEEGPMPTDLAITLIHAYYACVSFMDAQVGRILEELDNLGLADNTAIVLWGDHGWKLNDYGAWCKHTNFEIDTHVPMIFADPDHRTNAGKGTAAQTEFVDIYPTLSELCGLPVPEHCDGLSAVPLLNDPVRPWKEAAFSQFPRGGGHMGYSLRTERYRYTEWIQQASGEVAARELYDHSDGPIAVRNLAADESQQETVERLSALLDGGAGWRSVRDRVA